MNNTKVPLLLDNILTISNNSGILFTKNALNKRNINGNKTRRV